MKKKSPVFYAILLTDLYWYPFSHQDRGVLILEGEFNDSSSMSFKGLHSCLGNTNSMKPKEI